MFADVRSSPYSQYNPQFNRENFKISLQSQNIAYVFLGDEFGARRKEKECYKNDKVDYDLVSQTELFQKGIKRMEFGVTHKRIALVCAEKNPLTCHRTILVARHLKKYMNDISHILSDGSIESQVQLEIRLLKEHDLYEDDFFLSPEERLNIAYQKQADIIAYQIVEELQEDFQNV